MGGAGFMLPASPAAHAVALQQCCRQGTSRQAVFWEYAPPQPLPTIQMYSDGAQQPLSNSAAIHQSCCQQHWSGAHPVQGARAIGVLMKMRRPLTRSGDRQGELPRSNPSSFRPPRSPARSDWPAGRPGCRIELIQIGKGPIASPVRRAQAMVVVARSTSIATAASPPSAGTRSGLWK